YKNNLKIQGFVPLEGLIEKLRIKKDDSEIKKIKDAVKVADDTFSHVLKLIKPGVAEIEIAAEIEYYMKKNGAKGPSFETIVASGKRAALPHGVASEKKLEIGDAVTMDYGAIYGEYCSDMTRTVFLGKPADELLKIYRIVLDAQLKAIEGAIAGVSGKDIDAIARGHIETNGYGNCFGHGLGHGVGLEIHEEPRLSPMGNLIMKDGMVVTVEPGIYVTGLGGVRIEDMIVINGEKPEILTSSTKELIIL
ncbi:MAG TPA: M24 family metallopeptidase, partial [Clostridia bacterium]